MDDLRPLSHGIITPLFVIGTLTILMRCYVRAFTMRAFHWDDWAMAAMLFFNCVQQGILYFFLEFGAGLHIQKIMETHPEWIPILLKGLLAEEFWYIWMQFAIKICFLLFYFRLSNHISFRRALWAIIAFHVVTTVVIWLLYGLQCRPLAAFYEPENYPGVKCLDTNVTYFVPYTLNMTTDLLILVLPLPVIWTLQMSVQRRLGVIAVLTTGGSAVLTSGLRAIILFEFATSPDFTWSLGKMVIISNVEMQVGIVAANMPALKAFYTCWRDNKLGPGQGVSTGLSGASPGSKGSQNGMELQGGLSGSRDRGKVKTPGLTVLSANESEEKLFQGQRSGFKRIHEERM
ncbi:hypothetical protein FSARC_13367 [Fusarium sarcochroum]|uniref:Rhodopsin domain-containing protein n=1 Tax=Fusarium sarcochroum TaxID=1208366 RepID=A0A8H4WTX5_9HYPO|nr:hypothetical protein FSARC_13367 [Fusarium sarcochroum]